MATLADLNFWLSGGAANTDPLLSIGGAISTAQKVLSQTATAPTTITGVTIDDAAGNAEGAGTLTYDSSATTLRWTPPSGTAGTAVTVGTGTYAIQGGSNGGLLKVTVAAGSLPGSTLSNTITIANQTEKVFDDVTKAESLAGVTRYRCIYVQNNHASDTLSTVKIWISANTPGQDNIDIALSTGGKNSTPATIASETTAPADANFTATNPIDETSALTIGDLAFGDYYPIWIKNEVPASTTEAQTENTFRLAVRAYV